MPPRVSLVDLNNPPPEIGKIMNEFLERTDYEYAKIAPTADHPWRQKGTPEHLSWILQLFRAWALSPRLLELRAQYDWYILREGLIGKKNPKLAEMMGVVAASTQKCDY